MRRVHTIGPITVDGIAALATRANYYFSRSRLAPALATWPSALTSRFQAAPGLDATMRCPSRLSGMAALWALKLVPIGVLMHAEDTGNCFRFCSMTLRGLLKLVEQG